MTASRAEDAAGDRPADLRLAPAAAIAWAAAAWGIASDAVTAGIAGGAALLLGAVLLAVRRGGRRAGSAVVALAAAAAVLASCCGQLTVRGAGVLPGLVAERATVRADAVVLADPRPVRPRPGQTFEDAQRVVVRVRLERVEGRGRAGDARAPALVVGGAGWDDVSPGARLDVRGRLVPTERGDDVVALLVALGPPHATAPPPRWQRVAESLRAGLREAAAPLSDDAGGLLPGLVVGDTSRLPPDLEEAMRTVGLTHLTAVSGANVAIVCGTVLVVASALGAGRRTRLALAAAGLAGFVVLARPEPSVLRAGVMGAVGLLGLATARRGRGVPVLCTAVVALCVVDPWLSRTFGFALSVLATGALLLLARPLAAALARFVPNVLAQAIAVPAAAQAACAPVVVLLTPQVPLLAVPANLLVAPAVAPATVLGVAATVAAPVWMAAAELLARLGGVATGWIAVVARTAASVPGASVAWPAGVGGAVLLALLTVLALAGGAWVVRRSRSTPRPAAVLAVVVVACLLAGGWQVARRVAAVWPPTGWRIVGCDVGQGDALVVSTGPGAAVVVDAGPDATAVDRCLRRLDVRHVELLVLTHFHADHVAGLDGVVDGRSVGHALVSPLAAPQPQARQALAALSSAGIPVTEAWAGTAGAVGDVAWRVVWPSRLLGAAGGSDGEGSAANDASVVLLVDLPGLRLLATGDIEPPAQAALRRDIATALAPDVAPVDVVKVAHHGSAAQDEALYRMLAPRVAVVSAGQGNDYGHPTPATLHLLADLPATVLRTDEHGDVAIGGVAGELWVATQKR